MWEETFIERTCASDRQLPAHVERELRAYLECGILACGFLRARCEDCGEDRVVTFSCQRRSFCPSCMGRRMTDTAAHLTDEILPRAPVRQWVLSLPYEIRYRLAWADLLRRVFRIDVTQCPICGGHMKVIAALTEPRSIQRYLAGIGLPSRAPPIAPARPQHEFDFAA